MSNRIDPGEYGLSPKTVIEQIGKNHLAIVINRKSRVIMSDGKKIFEKADRIRTVKPAFKISLKISSPLCSKTKQYLKENNIEII